MTDARYVPHEEATRGLDREQQYDLAKYVLSHDEISGTRFSKDGSREEFKMPSIKYEGEKLFYHFALVNEFRRTEGLQ